MRKRIKGIMCVGCAAALLLGSLTACGTQNTEQQPAQSSAGQELSAGAENITQGLSAEEESATAGSYTFEKYCQENQDVMDIINGLGNGAYAVAVTGNMITMTQAFPQTDVASITPEQYSTLCLDASNTAQMEDSSTAMATGIKQLEDLAGVSDLQIKLVYTDEAGTESYGATYDATGFIAEETPLSAQFDTTTDPAQEGATDSTADPNAAALPTQPTE